MDWGWNNNNHDNQGHQDQWNQDNHDQGSHAQDQGYHQEQNQGVQDQWAHDNHDNQDQGAHDSQDQVTQDTKDQNAQGQDGVEEETVEEVDKVAEISASIDAARNTFLDAPANATSNAEYSQRDVFAAINVVKVLESVDTDFFEHTLSLLGVFVTSTIGNAALNIATMGPKEISKRTLTLATLRKVIDLVEGDSNTGMLEVLKVASHMESLSEDEKNEVLKLVRRLIRSGKYGVKVYAKRTDPGVDLTTALISTLSASSELRDDLAILERIIIALEASLG